MSRYWVVDASPIILLAKAGHPNLLAACPDELLVPRPVADEVEQANANNPAREWVEGKGQSFVESAEPVASEVAAWNLGRDENHVLSYGLRHDGWPERTEQALILPSKGSG